MTAFARAKKATLLYILNGSTADLELVLHYPKREALLQWLDNAGVALELFQRWNSGDRVNSLPDWWQDAFNARLEENRRRVDAMFQELRAVVHVLSEHNIRYAVVKGFSLEPDFCPDIHLRHFVDLDLLVDAAGLTKAINCLRTIGYEEEGAEKFGEVRLVRQTTRPEPGDSIYRLRSEDKVEIHSRLWENRPRSGFDFPEQWHATLQCKQRNGCSFPTLNSADAITYHVMHAFQHMTGGWVRAIWLIEIARFMRAHRSDDKLWRQVEETLKHDPHGRHAFALVIALMNKLFGSRCTDEIVSELVFSLPAVLSRWVKTYGTQLCLADFQTPSRHFELIQSHFVSSQRVRSALRRAIWSSRSKLLVQNCTRPGVLMRSISRQASACLQWARWHAGGVFTRASK